MNAFLIWAAGGFAVSIVMASFYEWALHRYIMHRPLWVLVYPYRTHAQIHHRTFRADHTYHLIQEKDKWTIPMAWWNGAVLVMLCMGPVLLVAWPLKLWGYAAGSFVAFAAYYGAYEYMHWCMHLPKKRVIERSGVFFRLNGHHLLHHRYMNKNFNVVFPLADFCLGTLLLRSKVNFAQARGPAVPDVQPRTRGVVCVASGRS